MQEIIKSWIEEISSVIPSYFQDEEKIKENLINFVVFENIEWFNVALIYYQKPNAVFVQSKQQWDRLIDGKDFFIKKGEKGIKILIPSVEKESSYLKWTTRTVWDINQSQQDIMYENISNLKIYTESLQNEDLIEQINFDELVVFVLQKIEKEVPKYMNKSNILNYIKKCISYVLSYYLCNFEENKKDSLKLENLSTTEYISLYAFLDNTMKNLHKYLKEYFDELLARKKHKQELENATLILNMNIKERIELAKIRLIKDVQVKNSENID